MPRSSMGIDVVVSIEDVEDLSLGSMAWRRALECLSSSPEYFEIKGKVLHVHCLMRYYAPGYERGQWPEIYAGILALRAIYPGHKMYYHGDNHEYYIGQLVTDEWLQEMWEYWLGPDGDNYSRGP